MQAIELATKNGAEHLGIADSKGLIKEGMEADLILLEKDPDKDITNIRFIYKVFAKGKTVYPSSPIASCDIPEYSYPEGVSEIELVSDDGTERVDMAMPAFIVSAQAITEELWDLANLPQRNAARKALS